MGRHGQTHREHTVTDTGTDSKTASRQAQTHPTYKQRTEDTGVESREFRPGLALG